MNRLTGATKMTFNETLDWAARVRDWAERELVLGRISKETAGAIERMADDFEARGGHVR